MPRLQLDLTYEIEGPFLTAGGDTFGAFDSCFHRVSGKWLSVPKTHVKGKLLEAVRYLADLYGISQNALSWWLGAANDAQNQSERIYVSDLRPGGAGSRSDLDRNALSAHVARFATGPVHERFTSLMTKTTAVGCDQAQRTAIGKARTAEEHTLRIEEIQPSALVLPWSGRIETTGPDPDQLRAVAALLLRAARCITQFGGNKGVGYGRVRTISCSARIDGQTAQLPAWSKSVAAQLSGGRGELPAARASAATTENRQAIALCVIPLEPIYLASIKRRGSHFQEGLDYIPGSALKGAVAAAMNLEVGARLDAPITVNNRALVERWPALTEHFQAVRFLHATPAGPLTGSVPTNIVRPFPTPLSAFAANKKPEKVWDAVLDGIPPGMIPYFAPDCDGLAGYVNRTGCGGDPLSTSAVAKSLVLRTEVDPVRLRAANERLFGYSQITELVESGQGPARQMFLTTVSLPDDRAGLADRMRKELAGILPFVRVGKTNAAVSIQRWSPAAVPLGDRLNAFGDAPIVLTLASDWLLPLDSSRVNGVTVMTKLYDEAWKCVLKACGYEHGSSELITDVFAQQTLRGGWVGRRNRHGYRCFYLTQAGSVFVTAVSARACPSGLLAALERLEERGIPIVDPELDWRTCSYVPENGYGEVVACHAWHLQRRTTISPQKGQNS
jgi:hypothetical protein